MAARWWPPYGRTRARRPAICLDNVAAGGEVGGWPGSGDESQRLARSIQYQAEGTDAVSEPEVLMEGIVFGESPRWHNGQVWFSDWGANQVIALDTDGSHEVVVTVPSFPMCIDFLPDGRQIGRAHV